MTRPSRGFTLLELLVALALVGVLVAIAVPRVSAIIPGALLDQAARSLATDLRFARVKAIAENRRRRLVVELDRGAYRVEADAEGTFVSEGAPRTLPGGVTFDASASSRVSNGQISITFQPRGNTADNSTIALAVAGRTGRRVIVSTAGRVRIDG
ncbi:MAG: GspH/FimT family pseudopilin [Candidatus Binatia bacterium]